MLPFRPGLLLCSMLLMTGAQAQTPSPFRSCELLKGTLATRISPEIRGYTMEDAPASAPVPSGAKVIGTCEAGARKMLFWRFGKPSANSGEAPGAASAPVRIAAVAPAPAETPRAPPPAAPAVPHKPAAPEAKAPPVAPAPPTPPVVAASAPVAALKPVGTASAAFMGPPPPSVASVVQAEPMPAPSGEPARAEPTLAGVKEPGSLGRHVHWLWLLLAVPLGAALWAWISHRMAYDEAGLPRGPRLRL